MSKSSKRAQQLREETEQINSFRSWLPIKARLKQVGCDLPFYYGMDSYEDEFNYMVTEAKKRYPQLLEVHQLDVQDMLRENLAPWFASNYPSYQPIEFPQSPLTDEIIDTHITAPSGMAVFIKDTSGNWFAVILLNNAPALDVIHSDNQYLKKLTILAHELGHVDDATKGNTLKPSEGFIDFFEAETYAYCFAMDSLADRCNLPAYDLCYRATKASAESNTPFYNEVSKEVLARHKRRTIPDWRQVGLRK